MIEVEDDGPLEQFEHIARHHFPFVVRLSYGWPKGVGEFLLGLGGDAMPFGECTYPAPGCVWTTIANLFFFEDPSVATEFKLRFG